MTTMEKWLLLFFVSAFLISKSFSKGLPSFITICHRKDPKLNDCLDENIKQILPRLNEGIPELFIPPFDPLFIPKVSLETTEHFNATFQDIKIHNAGKLIVKDRKFDVEKLHLEVTAVWPSVTIDSTYYVDGRILVLQLHATGSATGNFTNLYGKLVANGKPYMKNGKQHVKWEGKDMEIKLGKPVFRFDNIFGDNAELNERTNKIVNDNIEEVLEQFIPIAKKVIADYVFGTVNKLFAKFSMDELFPDP